MTPDEPASPEGRRERRARRLRQLRIAQPRSLQSRQLWAASVGLVAFLALAGYPSIGGDVYHLAHALWGGLALTVSTVLLLALSNRWVPVAAALTGGVGAGLFVDEVGKFITRKNDYFFPLAATIVYLFLVLLALAVVALRRYRRSSAAAQLHAAFELAARAADGPLSGRDADRLSARLEAVGGAGASPFAVGGMVPCAEGSGCVPNIEVAACSSVPESGPLCTLWGCGNSGIGGMYISTEERG